MTTSSEPEQFQEWTRLDLVTECGRLYALAGGLQADNRNLHREIEALTLERSRSVGSVGYGSKPLTQGPSGRAGE